MAAAGNKLSVEALVTFAYLQLIRAPWGGSRSRSVSLVKYGRYEIRLIELLPVGDESAPNLWIELCDAHDVIDSCGCADLEAAVLAAADAISQARKLADENGDS